MARNSRKSRALSRQQSCVGEFQKNAKVLKEKNTKLLEQQKELKRLSSKINRRKKRLLQLQSTLQDVGTEIFIATQRQKSTRVANPTGPSLSRATSWRRRRETINFVSAIHGYSPGDKALLLCGLSDALTSSFKPDKVSEKLFQKKSLKRALLKKLSQNPKGTYLTLSNKNCSLRVLYPHNVLGKQKYEAVRTAIHQNDKDATKPLCYKELSEFRSLIVCG